MPIYEYRCRDGHNFEVLQSMSDDPVRDCEQCGAPVERVFHPIAVHFKGSGFYTTDYAKKGASNNSESKAESKSEKQTEKTEKTEKKAEAKSESKPKES